jgi:fatty acid desaturase
MVPDQAVLPDVLPTDRLTAGGKPVRELRTGLRRISDVRSVLTVVGAVAQTYGVVAAAGYLDRWWAYLAAFILMIRGHALLNILAHEAAHRLLFTRQWLNDAVGRWLLAYPSLQAMLAYRRAHFAHHRDEMGPGEPDLGLYQGYPISRASFRRKLTRDAVGISAYKNLKLLARAAVRRKPEALQIIAVQAVLLAGSVLTGRTWMYIVWFVSWCTGWKVSNRLRALAEHGGMKRSKDRRETTHVVRQSRSARFWIAPYNTGWHLAHHVDMGVPWRNLPRLHQELVDSGWLVPEIEYPSYRALWRALASGSDDDDRRQRAERPAVEAGTSFLSID